MPVIDTSSLAGDEKKLSVSDLLNTLLTSEVVVYFKDESGKSVGSRDTIDKIIADYSRGAADISVYNKWIQIDSTLDKAVKKFSIETTNLLNTLNSQDDVRQSIDNSLPPPQNPQQQAPQQPDQKRGLDHQLPVNEGKFDSIKKGPITSKVIDYLTKPSKKLDNMEKDLQGIGVGPEQAKALVRNQKYKKAETHPETKGKAPFTNAMIDDIIEKAEALGLPIMEAKNIIKEVYDNMLWSDEDEEDLDNMEYQDWKQGQNPAMEPQEDYESKLNNVFLKASAHVKGIPTRVSMSFLKNTYNDFNNDPEENYLYIDQMMVEDSFDEFLADNDYPVPDTVDGKLALYLAMKHKSDIKAELQSSKVKEAVGSKGLLDWEAKEAKAKTMSMEALKYSYEDCLQAKRAADSLQNDNSGYYSDEASVYWNEMQRRMKGQKR